MRGHVVGIRMRRLITLAGRGARCRRAPPPLVGLLLIVLLATALPLPAAATPAAGPAFGPAGFRTNLGDYPGGGIPLYSKFEVAFDIAATTATNPYLPYDPAPPPGVTPATGITVDARLLPPGETDWAQARTLPCFVYQPVEEVGSGDAIALLPVGSPDWRCRFAPDVAGTWTYKVRATDAGGTTESDPGTFAAVPSAGKGFIRVSPTDHRFFEYGDGTPFITPLINVEQGNPFNTLAGIRDTIPHMGRNGVRFLRWFPTGEGANFFVAPFGDTVKINWGFGASRVTAEGADTAAGKAFSFSPYYYAAQTVPVLSGARYRLSFRAKVTGNRVLRPQLGNLAGGTVDICAAANTHHAAVGETCTYARDGWHDYELVVTVPSAGAPSLTVALRGLYAATDAPPPFGIRQDGDILLHSIRLQRDESGQGDWGSNLLTRSDPDTFTYVDQRSAAMLDEILRLSEQVGVYHKLPLFHKNDEILGRFQADGTLGDRSVDNFYSDEGQAARWYQEAYARTFVARWSYSTALHSVELANENNFNDQAYASAYAIASVVRALSPRHILQSNSFWGYWIKDFWTDPVYGEVMDYSDKHWYANQSGSRCDDQGERCELISNVWDDSAAYVRECWVRFREYADIFDYQKPIMRGEGGVAYSATQPQHPLLALDKAGIYYHKMLWAHLGVLGSTCHGEWYPKLSSSYPLPWARRRTLDLYSMFRLYEDFLEDVPLSNGAFVEIGSDLAGPQQVGLSDVTGEVRAWGVQDVATDETLLWVDNAAHTWRAAAGGATVPPASATLAVPGFVPGSRYRAELWDPYAVDEKKKGQIGYIPTEPVDADGNLVVPVRLLARDLAIKFVEIERVLLPNQVYLPVVVNGAD